MATLTEIKEQALFNVGEYVSGEAAFDDTKLGLAVKREAKRIVETVPESILMRHGKDLTAVLDLTTIPVHVYASDDATAPYGLLARLVVGLPTNNLRVIRVLAKTWRRYVRGDEIRPWYDAPQTAYAGSPYYGAGPGPYVDAAPYGRAATITDPAAYRVSHSFASADFATPPSPDTATNRLRDALVLAPAPDESGLTGTRGARYLTELVYVPEPDVATNGFPDALADVLEWGVAARLLKQDPETAGLAPLARLEAQEALDALNPVKSSITIRRGRIA